MRICVYTVDSRAPACSAHALTYASAVRARRSWKQRRRCLHGPGQTVFSSRQRSSSPTSPPTCLVPFLLRRPPAHTTSLAVHSAPPSHTHFAKSPCLSLFLPPDSPLSSLCSARPSALSLSLVAPSPKTPGPQQVTIGTPSGRTVRARRGNGEEARADGRAGRSKRAREMFVWDTDPHPFV